jgi:FkbM family methyltransferase
MKADLRHYLRRFIPRSIYTSLRRLADARATIAKEGWSTWSNFRNLNGSPTCLTLSSLTHPFRIRRIPSHVDGIIQNVLRAEYDALLQSRDPACIIDAGSFIGDLACHWATRFPAARIVTLEPNADNFAFALTNTSPYAPRVTLLNAGLWSHPCNLTVSGSEMGSQVSETTLPTPISILAIDVPTLIADYQFDRVDILKLDIEGAERVVLGPSCESWIGNVYELVVEMHGQQIEDEIVHRLSRHGFNATRRRSLVFFHRK